jgi:hypothetical protein
MTWLVLVENVLEQGSLVELEDVIQVIQLFKKLCRVNLFVFESWQTAEDIMVLPCDFTAVCHDSPQKNRLNKVFLISKKV